MCDVGMYLTFESFCEYYEQCDVKNTKLMNPEDEPEDAQGFVVHCCVKLQG